MVSHAREILAQLGAAWADLQSLDAEGPRTLRIGTCESVSGALLPNAIRQMALDAPDVHITLHEDGDPDEQYARVAGGELDAAFADLPLDPGPFSFRELLLDPYVLVVGSSSPLARRLDPPTLTEIAALPLIAPCWRAFGAVEERMHAAGAQPNFVFRCAAEAGIQELVAQGLGAALLPEMAVNGEDPRIATIPLDGTLPARRLALYWHRDRRETRAVTAFLGALEAACASLAAREPRDARSAALTPTA
jgi:DNA-binding transcriptional LysR family regulator